MGNQLNKQIKFRTGLSSRNHVMKPTIQVKKFVPDVSAFAPAVYAVRRIKHDKADRSKRSRSFTPGRLLFKQKHADSDNVVEMKLGTIREASVETNYTSSTNKNSLRLKHKDSLLLSNKKDNVPLLQRIFCPAVKRGS